MADYPRAATVAVSWFAGDSSRRRTPVQALRGPRWDHGSDDTAPESQEQQEHLLKGLSIPQLSGFRTRGNLFADVAYPP
jgi:hypothetical protein